MTVYLRFKSKSGLLEELFDDVGARGNLGEHIQKDLRKNRNRVIDGQGRP